MRFDFDVGTSAGRHIRRAVAEFIGAPDDYARKPDITLTLSGASWAGLYLSQTPPDGMIANGDIKATGDAGEAAD